MNPIFINYNIYINIYKKLLRDYNYIGINIKFIIRQLFLFIVSFQMDQKVQKKILILHSK